MRRIITHRRLNNTLATLVIAVSLYSLLMPFLPSLSFWLKNRSDEPRREITEQVESPDDDGPSDDRLLIPSALVDEPIHTGNHIGVINDGGIWLRPHTQAPDSDGGNTVLVGHRFTYRQPNGPLYHLDKVRIGNEIGVRWQKQTTRYIVQQVKVVAATATEIETPTPQRQLTIYTCTPLLTAKDRLVIIATEALVQ